MPEWMVEDINLLYVVIFGMTFFCLIIAGVALVINKLKKSERNI